MPVDVNVTDCVAVVLTDSLPNDKLVELRLNVGTDAPSCSAKVCATPLARAVNVTIAPEFTEETVAPKLALVAPPGTVAAGGKVTAALLLVRLTEKPPLAAGAFRITVQPSVPAPDIDPFAQLSPVKTGIPTPLRPIAVDVPEAELLVRVRVPNVSPATVGLYRTLNVAV